MTDFDTFWAAYPRREAKLAAMKAYDKARRLASATEILDGVERYKRTMPEDKQYRPLPASWLNAGRWMDEIDEPARRESEQCPHTPECHNKSWCMVVKARERGEVA